VADIRISASALLVAIGRYDNAWDTLNAEAGRKYFGSLLNVPAVGRSCWDQGLTAAEMRRCHWVKPVMACQVKFFEWSRDDRLRQPVFLGLREDKKASEVIREKGT
jgi:ATP-dependent DNA ligase